VERGMAALEVVRELLCGFLWREGCQLVVWTLKDSGAWKKIWWPGEEKRGFILALGIFDFLSFLLWVSGCLSARGIEWVSLFIFIFLIYNYFLSLFCHFCYFFHFKNIFLKKDFFFLVMLVISSSFQYY
jgi:hypothetical protein